MGPYGARPRGKGEEVVVRTLVSDEFLHAPEPPRASDVLREIPAEEALAMLRAGRPLAGLRVKGDVVLGQETIEAPLGLELEGEKIVVARLPPPPPVTRPLFEREIDIRGCLFEGRVVIAGMHFTEAFAASSTAFLGGIDAQSSTFGRHVSFFRCNFDDSAVFSDATFFDDATFAHSVFTKADFFNVVFEKDARFYEALFRHSANFSRSSFLTAEPFVCLDFHMAKCLEAAYFKETTMGGIADLSGATFKEQADFGGASFVTVNFTNTKFGRLDLKWEQIAGGKLLFGETVLAGFENKPVIEQEEWTRLLAARKDAPLADKHRQYDVLKAIFISQGDHVSADGCFYEWKQVERRETRVGRNPESWFVKAFHLLNWMSCGYGVKPLRTVVFAVMCILLFAIAFAVLDSSSLAASISAAHAAHLIVSKLDLSATAFMNFEATTAGLVPAARTLFLVERLLGWLTLLLFVTTYTRLMLR